MIVNPFDLYLKQQQLSKLFSQHNIKFEQVSVGGNIVYDSLLKDEKLPFYILPCSERFKNQLEEKLKETFKEYDNDIQLFIFEEKPDVLVSIDTSYNSSIKLNKWFERGKLQVEIGDLIIQKYKELCEFMDREDYMSHLQSKIFQLILKISRNFETLAGTRPFLENHIYAYFKRKTNIEINEMKKIMAFASEWEPFYIAKYNKVDKMRKLLQLKEIDINQIRYSGGPTLLHVAVENRSKEIVELLLKHGIDPNAQYLRKTCLHIAVKNKDVDTLRILLEYNSDLNIKDGYGESVFDYIEDCIDEDVLSLFGKTIDSKLEDLITTIVKQINLVGDLLSERDEKIFYKLLKKKLGWKKK